MTQQDFERDLRELLRGAVGDPPPGVDLANRSMLVATARRRKRWVSAGAAVVAVVAVSLAAVRVLPFGGGPPTSQPTGAPRLVGQWGPWRATMLASGSYTSFQVADGSVYAAGSRRLTRIDPTTGAVLAESRLLAPPPAGWVDFAATSGSVWVLRQRASGAVALLRLRPDTLSVASSTPLGASTTKNPGGYQSAALAVDRSGHRLWVALGDRLLQLSDATGKVVGSPVRVDGQITELAVSADGRFIYSAVLRQNEGTWMQKRPTSDPATVERSNGIGETDAVTALVAAPSGVWVSVDNPMAFAEAYPLFTTKAIGRAYEDAPQSGAGSATVSGGTVWMSGLGEVGCANAATGAVVTHRDHSGRAVSTWPVRTPASKGQPATRATLVSITRANGRLLALYEPQDSQPNGVLVHLTTPSACLFKGP